MSTIRKAVDTSVKKKVNVILFQSVRGCGIAGSIAQVARGFAKNFLVPKKLADYATKANLAKLEEHKMKLAQLDAQNIEEAKKLKEKLDGVEVTFYCKVKDRDNIYGSIQGQDVAHALLEKGFQINKAQVMLSQALKVLGKYPVSIAIYGEVDAEVTAVLLSNADKVAVD